MQFDNIENTAEYEANQGMLRMWEMFYGYVLEVKDTESWIR